MTIMTKSLVTLTPAAIEQVKKILTSAPSETIGLRLSVKSKGCSGLTYHFDFAKDHQKFEDVIEQDGITLLIDPKATLYLVGTTIDYKEDTLGSSFIFLNPNEKGRCGCGESFTV